MTVALLGSLAVVFTVARAWPQYAHLLRLPTAAGVSTATWALAVACAVSWTAWGLRYGEPANVVANVLTGAGSAAVLARLGRERGATVAMWALGSVGAVLAVVLADASVPGLLAAAAVALGAIMFVPQAVEAWRTSDVAGISTWAWVLIAASALGWLAYAVAIREVVVGLPSAFILPAAAGVLARCSLRRPDPAT